MEIESPMKFILSHQPDVINLHIDATVNADGGQVIAAVGTTLDSFSLGDDQLDPPSVQYERSFSQVGQRSPGLEHTLVVKASDQNGKEEVAMKIWTD